MGVIRTTLLFPVLFLWTVGISAREWGKWLAVGIRTMIRGRP